MAVRRKSEPNELDQTFRRIDRLVDEAIKDLPAPKTRRRLPALWADVETSFPIKTPRRHFSLRLDEDLIEWFRGQGPGYQARMNAVLKAYMLAVKAGAL